MGLLLLWPLRLHWLAAREVEDRVEDQDVVVDTDDRNDAIVHEDIIDNDEVEGSHDDALMEDMDAVDCVVVRYTGCRFLSSSDECCFGRKS